MGTHPIFESDFDCLTEMSGLIGLGGYGSDSDDESGSGSPSSQQSKSPKQMEVDQDVVLVDEDQEMEEEDLVNADAAAEFSSELRRMSSAGLPVSIELPPAPAGRIDPNSRNQYLKMMEGYKKGMNINKQIKSAKSYRNPSIYSKLIDYFNIEEGGSNFPKDVFDPVKLKHDDSKLHYRELSKLQNQLEEKRQKEEKQRILLQREKDSSGPAVVSSRSKNHNGKSIPAVGILAKKASKAGFELFVFFIIFF